MKAWKSILVGVIAVASGAVVVAAEDTENRTVTETRPRRKLVSPGVGTTNYSRVRGNPRHSQPVRSWVEAKDYMASDGWRNDVEVRIPKVLPKGFEDEYRNVILPAMWEVLRLARTHNYMTGNCRICSGQCQEIAVLRNALRRVQILPGTLYLAVTEGQGGGATLRVNRRFADRRQTFYAYRVDLRGIELSNQRNPHNGRRTVLYGDCFFDLIVLCRNAGFGGEIWEVVSTEFKPPVTPEVREREVYVTSRPKTEVEAEANAKASANARAEGGNAVVYNYAAPYIQGYRPPDRPTRETTTHNAGGFTFQKMPEAKAISRSSSSALAQQWQQQQQQQWQSQWQELLNHINNVNTNVNVNENLLQAPISIAN